MEVKVWVLSGVVGFLVAILMVVVKEALQANKTKIDKIDKICEAVSDLTKNIAIHHEKIVTLFNHNIQVNKKLDELEERMREVEGKINKCSNCN